MLILDIQRKAHFQITSNQIEHLVKQKKLNKIAKSVHNTKLKLLGNNCGSSETFTKLSFAQTEVEKPKVLIQKWLNELKKNPSKNHILKIWINWAENIMGKELTKIIWFYGFTLGWCLNHILPRRNSRRISLVIRNILKCSDPLFILGYADDNPGYIPPFSEFKFADTKQKKHDFMDWGPRLHLVPLNF